MAEPTKEKLLETEEVRARIEALKQSVAEMAEYVGIEERRKKLAELEEQQASADFWNNQAKAKEVIAATNAERAYTVPFDSLVKTVEDAGVMLELAEMESDQTSQQNALKDTLAECDKADEFFSKIRMQSLLGGKFDACNVFVKPNLSAQAIAPSRSLAIMDSGMGMPSLSMISRKRSRSSARSMISGEVPRMFTPAASSWLARLSGVWPPN